MVKGYKVFNPDWTCLNKQYTCPGKFEEDVPLNVCCSGMHFCKNLLDCFSYYPFNPENKVAEVIAFGRVMEENDKCCTDKLEVVREISWYEVLDMVNTGKGCSGFCNSGNRNSGNRNKTSFSNGCFNTEEPKIYLFNKPSNLTYRDWLNSKARYLLNYVPIDTLEWIYLENMTDEEKKQHPEAKTTGGYLKILNASENAVVWWRGLDERDKEIIKSIPNFDRDIFKEITGIDVES